MQRTCVKCGLVNDAADASPTAACPQCGAIYAKATTAAVRQQQTQAVRDRLQSDRSKPSAPERIAWMFAVACAGLGMVDLIYTAIAAQSAPQQAAGAAFAAALAVIPYCIARAFQAFYR
jgi:hypothetical protein